MLGTKACEALGRAARAFFFGNVGRHALLLARSEKGGGGFGFDGPGIF